MSQLYTPATEETYKMANAAWAAKLNLEFVKASLEVMATRLADIVLADIMLFPLPTLPI
jgi:hypothetical protein